MKRKGKKSSTPKGKSSNRVFEERTCVSPKCMYFRLFTPTWATQTFCCRQCQIDTANERIKELGRTKYAQEKLLREFDKRLGRLYQFFLKDGVCHVHLEFLRYEGIDLSKNVSENQNPQTNQPVKWFYEYGTELHPAGNNWFIIHYHPLKNKI